jgi:Flp pilus assembly protein TadD
MPFLTTEQFRSVVRTFLEAFPHSVLYYNTSELLLVGSPAGPPRLSEQRLRLLEIDATVHADLEYSHWDGRDFWLNQPQVLAGSYLCGPRELAALAAGAALLRDDRPALEYAVRNVAATQALELPTLERLRRHLGPVEDALERPPDSLARAGIEAVRERNLADLRCAALLRRAQDPALAGRPEVTLALARQAQEANPLNAEARRVVASALATLGRTDEARAAFREALQRREDDALAMRGMAMLAHMTGGTSEAIRYYRSALAVRPEDAASRNNLGAALAELDSLALAEHELAEAVRLNPGDASARRNLERVRSARGR